MSNYGAGVDTDLYRSINAFARRTPWLHGLARAYAGPGIALFALALLAGYVAARREHDRRAVAGVVWAGGAALAALAVAQVIGGAVGRLRPYTAMAGMEVLVAHTTDVSFPSDHATVAGAVAMGLLLVHRRLGLAAVAAAVLMAATRVYVGAHYPGDVLAGLALGAVVATVGHVVLVPWLTRAAALVGGTRAGRLLVGQPGADAAA